MMDFPNIGKNLILFSKHWKKTAFFFQCLEKSLLALAVVAFLAAAGCHKSVAPLPSEDYSFSISLSTNAIRVGDLIQLTLTAAHPADARVELPDISRGNEIIVRNQQASTQVFKNDQARSIVQYQITSFDVGSHLVSSGTVQFVKSDGSVVAKPFPPAQFEVKTLLGSPDIQRRDIKGLVRWPGVFPRWVTGLLIVAVLALLAGFLVSRFLSKPRTILHAAPRIPPHEIALASLRELKARGWIEQGNIEPFYVELSAIVRRYIEDRFQLRAPERTTEEFIREAVTSRLLSPDHQMLTHDFLEQCDLVKFAQHHPAQPDMLAAFEAAERLVRETIPAPPVPSNPVKPSPSTIPL